MIPELRDAIDTKQIGLVEGYKIALLPEYLQPEALEAALQLANVHHDFEKKIADLLKEM